MNNSIHFKNAIETIKRTGQLEGMMITEQEMAGKIPVSPEQFAAYKDGTTAVPDGLAERLLGAYGHTLKQVRFKQQQNVQRRGEEE